MKLFCDNCKKPFTKARNQMFKHNFCSQTCYFTFRRKYPYLYGSRKKTGPNLLQLKLQRMAKLYEKT